MEQRIKLSNGNTAYVKFRLINLADDDYDIDVETMRLISASGAAMSMTDYSAKQQELLLEQIYTEVEKYISDNHEAIYKRLSTDVKPAMAGWLH